MTYSSKLKRGRGYSGASSATGRGSGRSMQLVLVFMALIAAAGAWRWLQGRNKSLPGTASLVVVAGQATVTHADTDTGGTNTATVAAGGDATLEPGDEVQTSADSQAKLTLSGGETIELKGQTHLGILELYQTPVTRALVAVFALHEGKTLSRIRHALFEGSRYEIQMNTATVQAGGTIFECDALANDHAYVLVYDGTVRVSMGQQALDVQAGQSVDIWLGQTLAAVETGLALPEGPAETTPVVVAATATYTEREKTLFPPVLTPTRPGDVAPTPSGVATPQSGQLYTVQSGDTLYSIARKFGVKWEDIYEANKDTLTSPELVRAGQQLRIPK